MPPAPKRAGQLDSSESVWPPLFAAWKNKGIAFRLQLSVCMCVCGRVCGVEK